MKKEDEIYHLEQAVSVLEESIRKRELSSHPEKYIKCLENDRVILAKTKERLANLKTLLPHE